MPPPSITQYISTSFEVVEAETLDSPSSHPVRKI